MSDRLQCTQGGESATSLAAADSIPDSRCLATASWVPAAAAAPPPAASVAAAAAAVAEDEVPGGGPEDWDAADAAAAVRSDAAAG
jgi:hypothetical protein